MCAFDLRCYCGLWCKHYYSISYSDIFLFTCSGNTLTYTVWTDVFSSLFLLIIVFPGVGLGFLVLVKGHLNASAYQDILFYASNFMGRVWPFSVPAWLCLGAQSKFHKAWLDKFGMEELNRPAQSPGLNPIEHLWDELEWRLWVSLSNISVWPL